MKNICIFFERGNSELAKAIRWFTDGEVNHVGISYFSDDWQEEWVVEALPRGLISHKKKKNQKWYSCFKIKYEDAVTDVWRVRNRIGNQYDYLSLIGFGWVKLWWKLFKIKIRKPWRSAQGQLCSEAVAEMIKKRVDIKNPQWIDPQQLLDICRSRPDLFEEVSCE